MSAMKKLCVCAAAASLALFARPARANVAGLYGTGQAGLQTKGDTSLQYGFEAGAHVLIFDGYIDYMAFGAGRSVSRAIVGLRGGPGFGIFRLVLRAGVGAIRETSGALTATVGAFAASRTGAVMRGGVGLEGRLLRGLWLGVGVDGEAYELFNTTGFNLSSGGSDALGVVKLTLELGI
jgi:hypothetical protein